MIAPVVYFASIALFLMEGALLNLGGWDGIALNMPLCVTIYLGLNRDLMASTTLLFLLLLPAEWMYSAPFGYHALGLTAVFLILRLVRGFVQNSMLAIILVAFVASMVQALVMISAIFFSRTEGGLITAILWGILPAAAVVGASGPAVVALLRRLEPEEAVGLRF